MQPLNNNSVTSPQPKIEPDAMADSQRRLWAMATMVDEVKLGRLDGQGSIRIILNEIYTPEASKNGEKRPENDVGEVWEQKLQPESLQEEWDRSWELDIYVRNLKLNNLSFKLCSRKRSVRSGVVHDWKNSRANWVFDWWGNGDH